MQGRPQHWAIRINDECWVPVVIRPGNYADPFITLGGGLKSFTSRAECFEFLKEVEPIQEPTP